MIDPRAEPPLTLRDAIAGAERCIPRRDAETLLLHVCREDHRDRAWLLAHPEAPLTVEQVDLFEGLVNRRKQHEPLQYLVGHQEFYGLDLLVSPGVLIPRPETELLVEAVLVWAQTKASHTHPLHVVDVGTGSGAIALALAAHLGGAVITAVDRSPAALAVARGNGSRLGLAHRVSFRFADLLQPEDSPLGDRPFDVVVSNPPYVPSMDAATMQPEVRDFEPHTALFAGEDGLGIYRRLLPQAMDALRPGGLLALEFGFGQRDALAKLLRDWNDVHFGNDLAGIPRIATAERP